MTAGCRSSPSHDWISVLFGLGEDAAAGSKSNIWTAMFDSCHSDLTVVDPALAGGLVGYRTWYCQAEDDAKELLKRSGMSVLEIGVRVRYLNAKHFREIFRREAGVSPNEFRTAQS
jgi:hypothetical protein